MAFILKNSLKLAIGKQFLRVYCPQNYAQQGLKTTAALWMPPHKQNPNTTTQHNETNNASQAAGQKKFKESPKITLIHHENITVTALEEAKHLAKRRSMHLVQIQEMDSKTQRPVYKLLTPAELLQHELAEIKSSDNSNSSTAAASAGNDKTAAHKKSEKTLNIGSRITDHDLSSRLKNISKWLNKHHEVRILIQGSSDHDMVNCEKIFKTIEESIKTPENIGKVVQKRIKGSAIKFNIIPINTGNDKAAGNPQ